MATGRRGSMQFSIDSREAGRYDTPFLKVLWSRFGVVMRPWLLAASLLAVELCLSSSAVAQEPSLLPSPTPAPAPWEIAPSAPLPPGMAAQPPQVDPFFATGPDQLFDLDLLLGLPAAVRFGGAVFRHNGTAFLLEGMVGLEAIFPFAAVGARFRFTPCYGKRNAFVLKPGVDFYGLYDPFSDLLGGEGANRFVFAVGADVECLWYHNCNRCGWELGVDLGGLVSGATGRALPIVSLVAGLRF